MAQAPSWIVWEGVWLPVVTARRDLRGFARGIVDGGDFAEIFVEDTLRSVLRMVNGRVEEGLSGREHGVGIRIYQGLSSVYAYTSDSSRSGLLAAARQGGGSH